jgi:major membrane immunogen (membrane-anchored lipoprotein)
MRQCHELLLLLLLQQCSFEDHTSMELHFAHGAYSSSSSWDDAIRCVGIATV